MKRFINVFLFFIIFNIVFFPIVSGQVNKSTNKNNMNKPEIKNDSTAPGALAEGFQSINWNSTFSQVREKVKGKIIFEDENKTIITKDGNITYKYGFFYVDPEIAPMMEKGGVPASPAADGSTDGQVPLTESRFFFAVVEFPYLSMEDVKKSLSQKFGEPKSENIKNNNGAILWENQDTMLVMWVDRYEKKPFVRKLNYFSKNISKEINKYHYIIFNKEELKTIEQLKK